jgi:hypothetical protein
MRAEPAEWLRRDGVYVRAAQQQDENFSCPPSHRDSILTFTAQVVTRYHPPFLYRMLNMYFLSFFCPPEGRPLRRNKIISDAHH